VKLPTMGTLGLIDRGILSEIKKGGRGYLGISQIGHECDRKLWYDYTSPKPVDDARIKRIFDFGNMIEDYVVGLLRKAGLTVYDKDENGKQFGVVLAGGTVAGHSDGVVTGLPESSKPHLLEIKSMKNSSFNQLKKKGVKACSDTYWGQVQGYMGELKLENCLFIAMNKDNCELYQERIKYDPFLHKALINRAIDITSLDIPPKRMTTKKTFFKCKMCSHYEECWNE